MTTSVIQTASLLKDQSLLAIHNNDFSSFNSVYNGSFSPRDTILTFGYLIHYFDNDLQSKLISKIIMNVPNDNRNCKELKDFLQSKYVSVFNHDILDALRHQSIRKTKLALSSFFSVCEQQSFPFLYFFNAFISLFSYVIFESSSYSDRSKQHSILLRAFEFSTGFNHFKTK